MTEIGYDAGDRGEPEYPEQHECVWGWDEDVDGVQFLYCKYCPETMFPDEILTRINEHRQKYLKEVDDETE